MIDLSNKYALITGASGDIGRAIAKQLNDLGAYTYISGSNETKLQATAKLLNEQHKIMACDLSNRDACAKLVEDVDKLDILVCCAGITKDNLALRMSQAEFSEVIEINLTANFILNQAAIKKMVRNRWGRIINISSVVGVSGNPGQANYCASKAGIIGMSKALALEVASRNITINNIAPGFIETAMTDKLTDEQKAAITQRIASKTMGKPEDIAAAAAFLSSPQASYITGQTLHINGGMLMI